MANNFPAIRAELTSPDVKKMVEDRIGKKAGTFITSVLDLIGSDNNLSSCNPKLVMKEALKAAGLDLPVSKTLGFAYVIPYNRSFKVGNKWEKVKEPQFQMGYKGFIQLAIRTGQFKHLNAGMVYEGEEILEDRIKGTLEVTGKRTSDKAIGYFAYMQLVNGFEKAVVWSRDRVEAHAQRFSKTFKDGPWQTDFDAMALKTLILQLKSYMPMSIEMQQAFINDAPEYDFDSKVQANISENANQEVIDIEPDASQEESLDGEPSEEEKAEIQAREIAEAQADGPGF